MAASPNTWVIRATIHVSCPRAATTRPSEPRYPNPPPASRERAANSSSRSRSVMSEGPHLRRPASQKARISEGQGRPRIVEQRTDVGQEARAELPVDDPVVEGQRQLRHLPRHDPPLVHPGRLPDGAEAQDRRLPRV